MFKNILKEKYIIAEYAKWKSGKWVHYSKFPTVKVNLNPFHMDPAGIYLFPESFKTVGDWHKFPYKFTVTLPEDLKVLDLAAINTSEAALKFLEDLGVTDGKEFSIFREYIEKGTTPIDSAWEYLQRYFAQKPGAFNKRLRQAGYDAVFDDTGSIHNSEVQLVVLDSRKLSWKREDLKGSGYNLVKEVFDLVVAEGKKYGEVDLDPPKKKWSGYDKANQIRSTVKIRSGDSYVYITTVTTPVTSGYRSIQDLVKAHIPVSDIEVSAGYARPDLGSVKRSYREDIRDFKISGVASLLDGVFKHVFAGTK